MFCTARVIIGFGTTASVISGSAYLAETLPWDQRAWGLALFDDCFYIGALTAAGVTYGSFKISSSWAWRLPSLVQGAWGLLCISLLPWLPESPRWLVDQGRAYDAIMVLAQVNAGGDTADELVRLQFRQICETIGYERDPMTCKEAVRNHKKGAKSAALISTAGVTVALILLGVLTKFYGDTTYTPGIWATVFAVFLFSISYAFGWIPILFLMPAQMLYFRIRAKGMSMFSFIICAVGIAGNFAYPIAIDAVGYWVYIMNGGWNVLFFAFIWWYWVEVLGKTLEEIDALFDGRKHTDTPNVEAVVAGREDERWKTSLNNP
ncbi:hypothetical protein COL154_008379 [Colletotrichum chrysophilum]|nr:hypothetical protein COL154_008379 [Colletotrichum chrysophilum]